MRRTKKRIYLDYAAATPVLPAARRAFLAALLVYGNPSSPHEDGRMAREKLQAARAVVAHEAGVKSDAVIFTSGATEANNLLIQGHLRARIQGGQKAADLHVLYLPSVHASVREALKTFEDGGGSIEPLQIVGGAIDTKALASHIRSNTALIIVDAVCSETGTLWNVRDVRRALPPERHDIVVHVDASQAPRVMPIERTRFLADTLSLDAGKVGGVRGAGALIVPRTVPLLPLIEGGGQERGLRSGTESPALLCAFSAALTEAAKTRAAFTRRALVLREELRARITKDIPHTFVNVGKEYAPHILNISLVGRDTDYLVMLLSGAGVSVATKSACDTNEQVSRAVFALTEDTARASATLRISFGPKTTKHELRTFAEALTRAVRFLDSAHV